MRTCSACTYPLESFTHQNHCAEGIAKSEDATTKIKELLERVALLEKREQELLLSASTTRNQRDMAIACLTRIKRYSPDIQGAKLWSMQTLLGMKDTNAMAFSEIACACGDTKNKLCPCHTAGRMLAREELAGWLEKLTPQEVKEWRTAAACVAKVLERLSERGEKEG